MKKYITLMIIGTLVLCGLLTVAAPQISANEYVEPVEIIPQKTHDPFTALQIDLTAGVGFTAKITNIGTEDAINVSTQLDISIGNSRHKTVYYNTSKISPGESVSYKRFVFGLNGIFVAAYAEATNALRTVGIGMGTLLFFYIIQWYAYNPPDV